MPHEMTAPADFRHPDTKGKVLVIDDELDIREGLRDAADARRGYTVELAQNGTEGLQKLDRHAYDLVLLDLMMPDMSGMEVLHEVRERDRETPIFMITAYGSVRGRGATRSKLGANDYFSQAVGQRKADHRDRPHDRAAPARVREHAPQARAEAALQLPQHHRQERAHGARCSTWWGRWRPAASTILITGETGTGKELVAKAIHANSPRADQMFVAVNSGSLPPDLLESTLFGHVKGAFTSAIQTKKGYFEVADRGTIFFDEIGTIGPETQVKLLRVIQEKEFTPLGSTEPHAAWTCASWRRPMPTCASWSKKASSARTSITG